MGRTRIVDNGPMRPSLLLTLSLLTNLGAGCDAQNVTYDATYRVRNEGRVVTEGQGYGTLGSVLRFGQGADAVTIESQRRGGQAGFTVTFADEEPKQVSVKYGASQEVASADGRVSVRLRVDSP